MWATKNRRQHTPAAVVAPGGTPHPGSGRGHITAPLAEPSRSLWRMRAGLLAPTGAPGHHSDAAVMQQHDYCSCNLHCKCKQVYHKSLISANRQGALVIQKLTKSEIRGMIEQSLLLGKRAPPGGLRRLIRREALEVAQRILLAVMVVSALAIA